MTLNHSVVGSIPTQPTKIFNELWACCGTYTVCMGRIWDAAIENSINLFGVFGY
ncbi:hypothetical protein AB7X05_17075 [Providencia rettgeri]